jgi:hypothetical protein
MARVQLGGVRAAHLGSRHQADVDPKTLRGRDLNSLSSRIVVTPDG